MFLSGWLAGWLAVLGRVDADRVVVAVLTWAAFCKGKERKCFFASVVTSDRCLAGAWVALATCLETGEGMGEGDTGWSGTRGLGCHFLLARSLVRA